MKKLILSILIILSLICAYPAYSLVVYNCDSWTGGGTRALDYLSVSDLNNKDRAMIVYKSGTSTYLGLAEYDASGTTVENTSTHPYFVRPNNYSIAGVWCEIPLSWVDLTTTLSITNLIVTGTNTVNNLVTNGIITANSVTAQYTRSGASLFVDPTSGATLPVTAQGCIIRHDNSIWSWWGLPAISGTTVIYFKFIEGAAGAGVTLQSANSQPFLGNGISGSSTFVLPSGNQFESTTIYGIASGTSKYWFVEESGGWKTRN